VSTAEWGMLLSTDLLDYRNELTSGLSILRAKLEKARKPRPELLQSYQGLLDHLRDLDTGMVREESAVLRLEIVALRQRLEALETFVNMVRPVSGARPGQRKIV